MMKKTVFVSLLLALSVFSSAQNPANFRSPLDIPLVLSGNFGELRSDHFHSGIDIKTQGSTGLKVYAVQDGYVSRIKVQANGYGKAIYIAHPNGFTSVYGHLLSYNESISEVVKKEQYSRESFEVDMYLEPGKIKVSKGDVIAYSGNSGSSSGPHLHFEIRKTSNQHPLNGLKFSFPVRDDIPPRFTYLAVYPGSDKSQVNNTNKKAIFKTEQKGYNYGIEGNKTIKVYGDLSFGVEVYDYLNDAGNKCGIFSLELVMDGEQIYYSEMSDFSFAESRYINAHIDYEQKINGKKSIQRLYKLPHNNLSIYKQLTNDGMVSIQDTLVHQVIVRATDSYGNESDLAFRIQGSGSPQLLAMREADSGKVLPYNAAGSFRDSDIIIDFPAFAFYEDLAFKFQRTNGREDLLSDIYHLHNAATPVHKEYRVRIKYDQAPGNKTDKLCLVGIDDQGEISYSGGEFKNGYIEAGLRSFGSFAVSADSTAPRIEALNIHYGINLALQDQIKFKVSDDLSGIASYNAFIDNRWILLEYDPKNEVMFHIFDSNVPVTGNSHELEVYLSDAKGNKTAYHTVFIR